MTSPSVGRIVHYKSFGTPGGEFNSECRAAVVTEGEKITNLSGGEEVHIVSLAVLNPTGLFFDQDVPQCESQERGGTWHWPCVAASIIGVVSPDGTPLLDGNGIK